METEIKEKWSNIKFESSFEPTLNPFKNGLLVNYKKVGTRYMSQLLSLPLDVTDDKLQMDLIVTKNPKFINGISLDYPQFKINYENELRFCYTYFDNSKEDIENRHKQNYIKYTNSLEFLNYCEVSNYTDLFFNNKKDIIFLVRNPLHRFFSGVIQVLYSILYDLVNNKELVDEIYYYTNLNIDELNNISSVINHHNIDYKKLSNLNKTHIQSLFLFVVEKKWNLLFQDIHTQTYLFNYLEWIYNIKDKSKIKIIDLKDCRSNKSLHFFTNLIGNSILENQSPDDPNPKTYWDWLANQTGTNEQIYNIVVELFLKENNKIYESSIYYYLKDEFEIYDSLINSSYYIDLKD